MKNNKKFKKIGLIVGTSMGLATLGLGVLFATKVVEWNVTPVFFGWFLIILSLGMIFEPIILKKINYKL